MSTSPHAAAAGAARQRIAAVLGPLQQDPNVPPGVLEIVSSLAAAMGPLFQLERDPAASPQLFVQARGVLQQTLERIQTVDQSYPGVGDATGAIAASLGIIFQAMREAGLAPGAGGNPAPAVAPAAPPVAPAMAAPVAPQPLAPNPAAFAATQAQPQYAPPIAPAPAARPAPAPPQAPAVTAHAPAPAAARPASGTQTGVAASVPLGPNGMPRLEGEIGVHSETNFYTDFLGDIRNHGGIFIATFHVLPMGTACEVVLTFPGDLRAEFRGVVRWKREADPGVSLTSTPGLGIEITHAPAEAWDLIDRFMRKREPIMHEM